jgi:hypothetical protein
MKYLIVNKYKDDLFKDLSDIMLRLSQDNKEAPSYPYLQSPFRPVFPISLIITTRDCYQSIIFYKI